MKRGLGLSGLALVLILAVALVVVLGFVVEDPAVEEARAAVRSLTVAVQAYEARSGVRPPSLEHVRAAPGDSAGISGIKDLLDPWGREYRYDPDGPRNGGLRPDIWSQGPDPNDPAKAIGNWP